MSSVLITGILKDAFGAPIPNYEFFFEAIRTSDTLLNTTNAKFTTSGTGSYSFTLEYGTYTLKAKPQRDSQFKTIASNILVYSQGLNNKDIQYLLTSQADLENIDQTLVEELLQVKADILQALTYSVVDMGNVSLAGGVYPTPRSNSQGGYFSSLWYVTVGGTVSGTVFTAGDQLLYSATSASYRKIDNTDLVTSVNGMTGTVVVTTITGNAGTATTLQTARTIGISGDGTGTATSFNGSANITIPFTLATVATAGTYKSVTVDTKGRVTAGTNPTTLAGYGITDAQPLDAELTALAGLTTNGIIIKTAAGATTTRSIAISGTGLSITNADGIAGNPTITSNATNLNTVSTIVARDASGNFSAGTISAALSGNATTASTLATSRSISITGDGTWTTSFNGGTDVTSAFTLATVATAGTYANVTINAKGLVTSGNNTPTITGGSINNTPIGATTVSTGAFSTLTTTGNTTVGGVLTVTGNLIVNGTTTTVNLTTVMLDDPILTLGGDVVPTVDDGKDRGIEFRWHNGTAAKVGFFGFDNSTGYFTFIPDATNTSEVFAGTTGTIAANLVGAVTGNATTASTLATARSISITGDGTWAATFSGAADVTAAFTLASTGVTAGTYPSVTVDVKGRVTSATSTLTINTTNLSLTDATDATKIAKFLISGNTTGTTRTYTLPNASSTLVDLDTNQTIAAVKTFSATTQNIGSSTATSTINLGYGATLSGSTKTINIGTAGVSGSITNINIGSSVAGSLGVINLNNDVVITTTGYLALPDGTTAQRPSSPINGMIRYNTDTASFEGYVNNQWGGVGGANANGGFSLRNKIVDGRFDFWYEATTQSTSGYGSSTMWMNSHNGSTKVVSRQPLVAGVDLPANDCPSTQYFLRTVVTSVAGASNYVNLVHKIENVNTLAGKTATLSFYAKADSTKNITVWLYQNFGSGGSVAVNGIGNKLVGLTTTWKRYSVQITLPSISGKTIGTSNYMSIGFGFDLGSGLTQYTNSCGQQSGTFDIACVQLEEGTVASPFEELTTMINSLLVQRYFLYYGLENGYIPGSKGYTSRDFYFKVPMRVTPTVTYGSYYNLGGTWTGQNNFRIDDSDMLSSSTAVHSDTTMLIFVLTTESSDGKSIRCQFIADARL